jgi:hypothetical protein
VPEYLIEISGIPEQILKGDEINFTSSSCIADVSQTVTFSQKENR